MDAGELHRLGRRLLALSRAASGQAGDLALVPGQEAVLEDLLRHPNSTVSEIRDRTGFTQSYVSASVARLRDHGLIQAAADPSDGRRTRLRTTRATTHAISKRGRRTIDDTIATAVAEPDQADRALELLDELARILPATTGRLQHRLSEVSEARAKDGPAESGPANTSTWPARLRNM